MRFLSVCIIRIQSRNHTRYFKQGIQYRGLVAWLMKELKNPVGDREATWNLATSGSCYTLRAGGPTSVTKTQNQEPSGANLPTCVQAAQKILKLQREGLSSGNGDTKNTCPHRKRGRYTSFTFPLVLSFHTRASHLPNLARSQLARNPGKL